MSAWYEHGYPGAPMVKVAGFPRPLYPPDASKHGKRPSVDGPDVVAYKRTISRAGRWPWQTFDDTYSNGFAHGKAGGNVRDSGVAGVQRQQHIDATGWLGEKTFNALRSIVIPEGLAHAGEHAMDGTAAELVDYAFRLFGGSEPAPEKGSLRASALAVAVAELGVAESPAQSNLTPYGAWYGMNGEPWCAMFTSWAYETAGGSPSFERAARYAYVPYLVADARARRYGLRTTDDPVPGDLVAYDFEGDGEHDHVGIFERWTSGTSTFAAIEGNTSPEGSGGSDWNGGQVCRRSRSRSGCVFIRVDE